MDIMDIMDGIDFIDAASCRQARPDEIRDSMTQ
jgi:hypothetical protein